jgi:hypothetical protein
MMMKKKKMMMMKKKKKKKKKNHPVLTVTVLFQCTTRLFRLTCQSVWLIAVNADLMTQLLTDGIKPWVLTAIEFPFETRRNYDSRRSIIDCRYIKIA